MKKVNQLYTYTTTLPWYLSVIMITFTEKYYFQLWKYDTLASIDKLLCKSLLF